ncbi:MAG: DEAD/DEAH box helicase family protein [Oscillospiraceae bacterium]|nr:DEAD/DEAH box helicase family protein [Oscillospiraceae bacterium]
MSNFEFLKNNNIFESFTEPTIEAEKSMQTSPVSCAILSRRALEIAVKWIYENDNKLSMPYQNALSSLVHDISFKNIIDKDIFTEITYIIKLGNFAVHNNKKVSKEEAILTLKYLHDFMKWLAQRYDKNYVEELYKELPISEQQTRKQYIDLDLKLAGWDFDKNITEELELQGMPNNEEKGFADYVLFGNDGKPLAVVEAKRTSVDPKIGKQQVKLYADCLEKQFAQRPIIYYTNGRTVHMWDDTKYPPRTVSGFYSQSELQTLINRRNTLGSLKSIYINENITNRPYQQQAIKSVCEAFESGHRKALLVMATGTGKTRTAISLVDVLTNNNWIKNVLFLADRIELVKQAKKNFVKLLLDMSCCNLLNSKDNPEESRIVFSTYQTMMSEIDGRMAKDGNKLFSAGHFDLIIIDEAHRSIYKKYQAIFEYFDGLLVGLTATPRNDVDKNTYRFFEIENDVPTFVYEYDEAVKEGYLVDYNTIKLNTDFLDRGITYSELPDEEKEEYENLFEDEDEMPDNLSSNSINSWLFNRDTIAKILESVMEKGLKVEGGDKLGKTIIFAKNHKHAEEIVRVFDELYPHYKGGFAGLIDNKVKYASSLIEDFQITSKFPQIAISVDMLDTGIDVPEVVNLVFFKPIKSKIKFWQMIGRGTRLCPDLYGLGKDKTGFYIFDCCKNFEFFAENEKGIETGLLESLTEKIYNYKLDLIIELQSLEYQSNEQFLEYRKKLIQEFIDAVNELNTESFAVKAKKEYIEKYKISDNWNTITEISKSEIKENLTPLFISNEPDEFAKRFDSLVFSLQTRKIKRFTINMQARGIASLVEQLKKIGTVPQIKEKSELIMKACEVGYWIESSFFEIEKARLELRSLIQFIEDEGRKAMYTDFTDTIAVTVMDEKEEYKPKSYDFSDYRKKVRKYFESNMENLTITKIRENKKLTKSEKRDIERILFEELGSKEDFNNTFGSTSVIEVVRQIVGLDKQTANSIFAKYINDNRLNTKQIEFVKLLIEYVSKNGIISMEELMEQPFNVLGSPADVFEDDINTFMAIKKDIEEINENARKCVG